MNPLLSTLNILGVRNTQKYANKLFNEHPNKYNMLGLSEMFSQYKVENVGIRAKNKEEDILKLDTPFIAHIGSDFVTVTSVENQEVSYLWNGKKIINSIQEFLETWSGIALLVESDEQSVEQNYKVNRETEIFSLTSKILLGLAVVVLATMVIASNNLYKNVGMMILVFFNITGVYVGYLLILKQLHVQSNHADKICSLFSKSDCNNVLESSAAKFLGVIGWSELGLGYFISNLLIILFLPYLISYLALLNICALPYSFWSVWYQKYKAKQWCPLCLVVQLLFWCVFIANILFGFIFLPDFSAENIFLIGAILSIPFLVISMVLPKLAEGYKTERITQEFNSFKMDKEVFSALLSKQSHYDVEFKTSSRILFGNPEAATLITVFTNPHCNPCANMHKRVESLLEQSGDKLCVQYIFSSFNKDLDISNKYLIAVYQQKTKEEMFSIYDKWFVGGKNNKEEFFEMYPVVIQSEEVIEEFNMHTTWKNETRLRATPTILVNGFELLDSYKMEDLIYLRI